MLSTIPTPGVSTAGRNELSQDEVYEVLSNRRRRFVIHALKRREGPVDVTELSKHVTAWEIGVEPAEVAYEDRRNVYSTLQRTHLPKLDEKDIVAFDEEENVVEPAETLEALEVYVEVLGSREIPWSLYYVGLAALAAALLLAVAVGTPGFGWIDPLGVGVFTSTAFGVSSIAHYVIGRHTRLGNTEKPPEVRRRE